MRDWNKTLPAAAFFAGVMGCGETDAPRVLCDDESRRRVRVGRTA